MNKRGADAPMIGISLKEKIAVEEGVDPFQPRLFIKGIKRGEAMIRRCSYHNSLPYPLMKGRGIKGGGLVNKLFALRLLNKKQSAIILKGELW